MLQKAPPLTVEQAPAYPENLARYHLGAQLEASPQRTSIQSLQLSSKAEDRNKAEAALLCDDPTVGYALPKGASTLLISLPNIEHVQSISFLNSEARGDVTIATASAKLPADSPQWRSADQKPQLTAGAVKATIGPSEAKYVKLTFNVSEPGRIAGLGVYSTPAVSDFTMPRPRKASFEENSETFALITYNFTDIHTKARALYVSSGGDLKRANDMIDDQPTTAYNFAADDATPTAVIDLGGSRTLRRLSAVYAPHQGSIDFYVVDSLPNQQAEQASFKGADVRTVANTSADDLPKTLRITDANFSNMKHVGSVVNKAGEGRASVDFPATTGRYVVVKWNPATPKDGFSVAEIAAFGASKHANDGKTVMSDGKRTMDGKQVADGKNILDNKDIPAEGPEAPAEGPAPGLPPPPPFTFIPQVPPTPEVPPTSR